MTQTIDVSRCSKLISPQPVKIYAELGGGQVQYGITESVNEYFEQWQNFYSGAER